MTRPLYQLGSFQFSLPNGVPQTVDHSADFRWEQQDRLGRDPANQFVGPGAQQITLDGVLFPGFSGRQNTLEELRTLARQGNPLMFTDGLGKVYGRWVIKQLRETKEVFAPGGGARQIGFNVTLAYYGEDNPGQAASPLSVQPGSSLANALAGGLPSFFAAGSAFDLGSLAKAPQTAAVAAQAKAAGFNLGQVATLVSTAAAGASLAARGDYVGGALRAFGMLGIDPSKAPQWAQVGINAAQLGQAYQQGRGPQALAVALEIVQGRGPGSLPGLVPQAQLQAAQQLLRSAGTVIDVMNVDPKITAAVRTTITTV